MKNLVIVESPTKARTIGKFLGKDYEIKFSMGHVMDLPKSKMGIDMENGFAPQLEVVADKKKIITELKKLAKTATTILLATDPDREGEAIAKNIQDLLGEKKKAISEKIKRIVFHEITEEAIKDAINSPREVDQNLADAQIARRVLDRLVGYSLSPLLWQKVRRGLSAGRVQSVALRLIVEREREIEKFARQAYFTISAALENNKKIITVFDLVEINGERIETQNKVDLYQGQYTFAKTNIDSEAKAKEIVEDLKKADYVVGEVVSKQISRSPQAPYTTSTLQQDASRRLGLPGKRTMSVAQKLYEEGFITYHRTDSVTIASSAQGAIISYIQKEFGNKYLPAKSRVYATKQKNAQEAHEAIRPTKVGVSPSVVTQAMGAAYGKLYELIWIRAVASQMADAITESTTVIVDSVTQNSKLKTQNGAEGIYRFKANGSVLIFDGFLKINPQALTDKKLPEFSANEKLILNQATSEFHETTPPPRYNDASLIKTLEEKSIGRPSTYASIVGTIESRAYINRDANRFIPTPVGMAVNDFLVKNFSEIDDIPFTAEMENSLDLIAEGRKEWAPMISAFYKPFGKKLEEVKGSERVKIPVEETDEACPECKVGKLVIRTGKFGKFLSCGRFPECRFTKPFVEETNFICPKDGGKVIVKKTRKGRKFFGCANYPNCDFAAWKMEDAKKPIP